VDRLLARAGAIRLPELFQGTQPSPLDWMADRCGIGVVAYRHRDLDRNQVDELLTWRLAQYLAVGFADPVVVHTAAMEREPLECVTAQDVHILAGRTSSGEILCYCTLRAVPEHAGDATLRSRDRPLLPVEETFGQGVFDHLPILLDLPIASVREAGRFIRDHRLDPRGEAGVRAPIEICVALYRLLTGPLARETGAVVGDFEDGVVRRTLEFFHLPLVVVSGGAAAVDDLSYLAPLHRGRPTSPFAFLTSDVTRIAARVARIEQALSLPGRAGVSALSQLRGAPIDARSALELSSQ
jgi:hypothetical protein